MHASEDALVDNFIRQLGQLAPWGKLQHAREFDFRSGRTDLVAVSGDGTVIAFEMKLTRWRSALQQAYRNLCFAHRSYVVLPREVALIAERYETEFVDRQVGLCYVDGDEIVVLREAFENQPLNPWLSNRAALYVSGA